MFVRYLFFFKHSQDKARPRSPKHVDLAVVIAFDPQFTHERQIQDKQVK